MNEFNEYMEDYKKKTLVEKKDIALEQLKVISGLTNIMCTEIGVNDEIIVTQDVLEGHKNINSEEDFVEAVVVYASSIQKSLCNFTDKMTQILEDKQE